MFKDEIALIRFLGREFIAIFNVFFLFPLSIILVLIGVINGVIWNVLLGIAFTYLVFLVLFRILIYFLYKKWEREYQKQMREENKVKYIIIILYYIVLLDYFSFFCFSAVCSILRL